MKTKLLLNSSIFLLFAVFVNKICGQYYPHRDFANTIQLPHRPSYRGTTIGQLLITSANNDNPFQRAYDNQGYYQRFADYGNRKSEPISQHRYTQNTYNAEDNGERNKVKSDAKNEDFSHFEDNDFQSNLDYSDIAGGKDFDPFKFMNDGTGGEDGVDNLDMNFFNTE